MGCRNRRPLPRHTSACRPVADYSDFELTADHRLVRELMAEREDVGRTLGLPLTDEPIEVYLFRDADRYRQVLGPLFSDRAFAPGVFRGDDTRWLSTRIGATAWRKTCGMKWPTDICTPSCPVCRCGWMKAWRNSSKCPAAQRPESAARRVALGNDGIGRMAAEYRAAGKTVRRGPIAATRLRGILGLGPLFCSIPAGKPWSY